MTQINNLVEVLPLRHQVQIHVPSNIISWLKTVNGKTTLCLEGTLDDIEQWIEDVSS